VLDKEENFYEALYRKFYKFAQTTPDLFGVEFSKNVTYPVLKSISSNNFIFPLPKKLDDKYVFEGWFFDDTDKGRRSMWTLFLSTLYHLAGHAAVSHYDKYEKWIENKTLDDSWRVIDFIEDAAVEKYLSHNDSDLLENIKFVDKQLLFLQTEPTEKDNFQQKDLSYFLEEIEKKQDDIKNKIMDVRDDQQNVSILSIANHLYQNRELLPRQILAYREHHKEHWPFKFEVKTIALVPTGEFAEQIIKLDELWDHEENARKKMLRRYKKHLKNLNFDKIIIPPGNLQSFTQIRTITLPFLRKIRQQIRMITNLMDEPRIDQIGYVDMQMAIQAIASEGQSTDIFERDELRRGEEAWVILVDRSASMGLRFDRLKEFTICMAECANELTGRHDAWAMYSFDNNFQILKDFKEKYGQVVQARIGSMENGGLSLLPDAIELSQRVLNEDPREKKYIFVITDGSPSGYAKIQEVFAKVTKKVDVSDINLVAIGVSKTVTKEFRNSATATNLRNLVAKFITAYRTLSSDV